MATFTLDQVIRLNFPGPNNRALRGRLRRTAQNTGTVLGLARTVALTASGRASLQAVEDALRAERSGEQMTTNTYLTHAAEIWTVDGPTGTFAEVLAGEVQDYGGNCMFRGSAAECVAQRFNRPTKLVPTQWRPADGDVVGADHVWQLVTAPDQKG